MPGRKGAGRIVIHYSSLEQLDGILAQAAADDVDAFAAPTRPTQAMAALRARRRLRRRVYPSCFSIVSPPETSNLPGPSMFSVFTTPLSTSIEKRWQRTPMPRAVRSSSSPSAFV